MTDQELAEAERLVRRIRAYNDVWHSIRDGVLGEDVDVSAAQRIARAGKGLLQAELLRRFPELSFLADHTPPGSAEALYGVQLTRPLAGHRDACHLPVRVAEANLTDFEIADALARGGPPQRTLGAPR